MLLMAFRFAVLLALVLYSRWISLMRDASSTSSSSVLERRSRRLKTFTSMTTPSVPGGAVKEASLTSAAFSPKIARRSRSSGASSVSDLGVILPTRISPGFTSAPMRIIPSSPRLTKRFFRDIRNIACDLFFSELSIARCQLKLFDIDRSVSSLRARSFSEMMIASSKL